MTVRPWWLLTLWMLSGHASELGRPLVAVTASQDVGAAARNAGIVELPDGRMAIANDGGMLLFDGARWRYFPHPDRLGGLWQLAPAADGRIYAGFSGDVGYFEADGAGGFAWHSLREHLSPGDREFDSVWSSVYDADRNGVWFVTMKRLLFFELAQPRFQSLPAQGNLARGFIDGTDFWVVDTVGGLQRVAGLQPLRVAAFDGSERFAGNLLRSFVRSDDVGWFLFGDGQLYRHAHARFEPVAQSLWPELGARGVNALLATREGKLVIAFDRGAPLEFDQTGDVARRYYNEDGIPDLPTYRLGEDSAGGLWLGQLAQITRVDRASGISVFDHHSGLPGSASLVRWRERLYVGANSGLYRLRAADSTHAARFERVLPQLGSASFLAPIGDSLLVGAEALYRVDQDAGGELRAERLGAVLAIRSMLASRLQSQRVWVGHAAGLLRIDWIDGQFASVPVAGYEHATYSLAEADAHTLWAADRSGAVWRLALDADADADAASVDAFGADQGLPPGTVRVYGGREQPWFATAAGLYRFDAASNRFRVPPELPAEFASTRIFCVDEDDAGNLWLRGPDRSGVAWRDAGGYRWDGELLSAVNLNPTILGFVHERRVHWVLRADSLLRVDLDARRPLAALPAPLTVAVDDLSAQRPLAFDAAAALPSTVRDLRVSFALPSMQRPEASVYRTQLLGIDREPSPWTARSERDYTNLPDGRFEFRIEARDGYGRVAPARGLLLGVSAPWWRSPWAKAAYALAALLTLSWSAWLGARMRQRSLLGRQLQLESTVAARTTELKEKNAQLAEQAQRLSEVDRLKTRFFVNVGHEFRTPLTLVLGPIDDLLRDARERLSARAREHLEMANRNARRVLDLIVELLDVNRIEHGQMRMTQRPTDVAALVRRVVADSLALIDRHGHRLQLEIAPEPGLIAALDAPAFERALSNLLGNAAKYMARGGCITVRVGREHEQVRIDIADQGRGISPEALPHVFDRFFQADGGDRASGYGIGLALVREIVEAHAGRIEVASTPGVGSCFTICLPAGDDSAGATDGLAPGMPVAGAVSAAVPEMAPERTAPVATTAADAGESTPPGRPRILVVDDHDELRARVRGLLAERFEVIEAVDGPSAWRAVRDELPDLLVCDVMMPGFDGIELTRRLRADPDTAAIGVLLLTAKAGSEHATAGLGAGANDYLSKPFDTSELLARVDAILGHAQRLRLRLTRESQPAAAGVAPKESPDQRWRRRLDELVFARLDDPELSIEALADAMHVDRSQLFRKCKELLGSSPSEYLRDSRLKRAHELLVEAAGNVSEVAYAVGFDSLSGFSRAFKARYGLAPGRVTVSCERRA